MIALKWAETHEEVIWQSTSKILFENCKNLLGGYQINGGYQITVTAARQVMSTVSTELEPKSKLPEPLMEELYIKRKLVSWLTCSHVFIHLGCWHWRASACHVFESSRNEGDWYTVAVVKDGMVVAHLPMSTCVYQELCSMFLRRGGMQTYSTCTRASTLLYTPW